MVESLLWWLEMLLWRVVCLQSHSLQAALKVEWNKKLLIEIGLRLGFFEMRNRNIASGKDLHLFYKQILQGLKSFTSGFLCR